MRAIFCPSHDSGCIYWKEGNICDMGDEGLNPMCECDDFAGFWDPDDEYWEEVSKDNV